MGGLTGGTAGVVVGARLLVLVVQDVGDAGIIMTRDNIDATIILRALNRRQHIRDIRGERDPTRNTLLVGLNLRRQSPSRAPRILLKLGVHPVARSADAPSGIAAGLGQCVPAAKGDKFADIPLDVLSVDLVEHLAQLTGGPLGDDLAADFGGRPCCIGAIGVAVRIGGDGWG